MLSQPILYGGIEIMKPKWSSLSRHEQKLMARRHGRGSTRIQDLRVISECVNAARSKADGLSPSGEGLCELLTHDGEAARHLIAAQSASKPAYVR